MAIKFGTSGWRAILSEDFTFANVRKLTHAVAGHVKEHLEFGFVSPDYRQHAGSALSATQPPIVIVGYDPRFLSEEFAREAAEVFAADGLRVLLSEGDVPTPAVAWTILDKKAVGGVVITASHNPGYYNGYKWSPFWGGPAPLAVTEDIERRLAIVGHHVVRAMPYEKALKDGWVVRCDFRPSYFKQLKELLDVKKVKASGLKVGIDCLHGAARNFLRPFLESLGLKVFALREERDVLFSNHAPEPTEETLADLAKWMKVKKLDIGLSCDGDADRFGILDKEGHWVSANDVLGLALHHLVVHRGFKGHVARSLMTSHFVDAVAKSHGLRVRETPVGFKFIGELLRGGGVILGGEESGGLSIAGHVPEKDGILACLLMLELMAFERKPLIKVREQLFKKLGEFHNVRLNFRLDAIAATKDLTDRLKLKPPTVLAGASVWRIDETDGFKFILKDGRWLGLRFSGTEPVVRLYAEAFDPEGLKTMVDEGKRVIRGGGHG